MTTSLVLDGWTVEAHHNTLSKKHINIILEKDWYNVIINASQEDATLFPVGTKVKIILEKE
jgi:hypothetical protein